MMGRLAMLLLLFAGPVLGDLYLHVWTLSLLPHPLPPPVLAFTSGSEQRRGGAGSQMPRGSNNRVDEQNTNRNNNNRMFDSQNNNKGGYSVGVDVDDYEDGVGVQTPCPAIFLRRRAG